MFITRNTTADGKPRRLDLEILRTIIRLQPEHEPLLVRDGAMHALLDRLIRAGLLAEAASDMPGAEWQALDAADTRVRRPDDATGRQAAQAASAAGNAAPGACLPLATCRMRASVGGETRAGHGVETAVTRAAHRDDAGREAARLRRFFVSAHYMARSGMGKLPPETPKADEASPRP